MAKPRKKKKQEPQGPTLEDIKRMWKVKPPQEWLGLLEEIAPQQEWAMKGHTQITAKCPYHNDDTPSFMLSFDKGMGKCFGASCGKFVTDIINLIAKLRNCNYTEALTFVSNRFNLKESGSVKQTELTKYSMVQEAKKQAAVGMQDILTRVWRDNPEHLQYCRPALDYLVNVRQIPPDVMHLLPIGVFAKPVHLKEYVDEELHSEFDEYFGKYFKDVYYGNLVFHYNDSPGSISRFKFRQKNCDLVSKLKNYKDFENLSFQEKSNLFSKSSTLYLDDPYAEIGGVFGLFTYQHLVASQDTNAYLTEGEFDVLAVMAHQFLSGQIDFMIFGSGGKAYTDVQFLRELGIRTIWLVPDHPTKDGDGWAQSVLQTKNNFSAAPGQTPLQFKVFQWPVGLTGFDLDEAVKSQGYEIMARYLATDRNSNFLNAMTWIETEVSRQLDETISKFKKQKEEIQASDKTDSEKNVAIVNLSEQEKTKKHDLVLWGYNYINDPAKQVTYINKYASDYGVDISENRKVNNSGYDMSTTDGVAEKIKSALEEYISFGYYVERSGGVCVYGWSKSGQNAIEIQTKESEMFKNLSIQLGQETLDWLDSLLRENSIYLEDTAGDGSLNDARVKRRNAKDLLNKAFERSLAGLRNFNQLRSVTQGIHYIDLPKENRVKNQMYMVNGNNIFRGTFTDKQQLEWEKLETTVDGSILFETLSSANQWSCIEDVSDLYDANKVDIPKVFEQVRTALNGWVFHHHDTMAELLAAQIMAVPIMSAVGNVNIVFMTGEKESGKTSLLEGLLGGGNSLAADDTGYRILEPVKTAGDATNAAIYQSLDGSSQLLVMDEAESQKQQKTNREQALDNFIRTIYGMPQGMVFVNRGGKGKDDLKQYRLKFPIWFAAIATPPDTVFLSRTLIIKTVKQPNKFTSADAHMDKHFTQEQLRELRKQITMGLLPHIPEITVRIKTLRNELQAIAKDEVDVSNRFLETVLTPLVVYEMAGGDPKKLYEDVVRKNKAQLENIHSSETQSDLMDACLFNKNIKIMSSENMTEFVSARQLLVSMDFTTLNNSESGVYVMDTQNWLVFVWRQAKYTVLQRTSYQNYGESTLKDIAQKSNHIVEEVSDTMHAQIVNELNLPDVKSPGEYTVLSAEYLTPTGKLSKMTARPGDENRDFSYEGAEAEAESEVQETPGAASAAPEPDTRSEYVDPGDFCDFDV